MLLVGQRVPWDCEVRERLVRHRTLSEVWTGVKEFTGSRILACAFAFLLSLNEVDKIENNERGVWVGTYAS